MTKISQGTFFLKKVFPVIWFGFLIFFFLSVLLSARARTNLVLLLVPIVIAILGFVQMKNLIWDLADEVFDCGDYLVVRNRGEADNVLLSNIMDVSVSAFTNPPRITLRLVNAGKFGKEITFMPINKFTLNPLARNQVAENLMVRVDQARSKRVF